MRQIFRLEHPASGYKGPYTGPSIKGFHNFSDNRRHPTPLEDSGLRDIWSKFSMVNSKHWMFGFGSFTQFKAWFYNDDILVEAYKAGYVVNVYEVPDIAIHLGNAQAVFHDTYHTALDICYTLNEKECLTRPELFDYTVITEANQLNWSIK